jgi:hypothetical protein
MPDGALRRKRRSCRNLYIIVLIYPRAVGSCQYILAVCCGIPRVLCQIPGGICQRSSERIPIPNGQHRPVESVSSAFCVGEPPELVTHMVTAAPLSSTKVYDQSRNRYNCFITAFGRKFVSKYLFVGCHIRWYIQALYMLSGNYEGHFGTEQRSKGDRNTSKIEPPQLLKP